MISLVWIGSYMTINFVFRKKESTDTGLCFLNDKNLKDWNDWWFALREECPYSEFSGPHFPVFGLNIQSECGKMQTRITPNTDTFSAVLLTGIILIDLQKACDTMYHGILLGTLSIFFFLIIPLNGSGRICQMENFL